VTLRQYEILRRETADELANAVNAYINQGWEPLGGVAYSYWYHDDKDSNALWCQAVIRTEKTGD
jgi:hypothetical protein